MLGMDPTDLWFDPVVPCHQRDARQADGSFGRDQDDERHGTEHDRRIIERIQRYA